MLVQLAGILKRSVRRVDTVGRIGGEEFLIVMADTQTDKAFMLGDRIREEVQREKFHFVDKDVAVTIRIGVVSFPAKGLQNKEDLLKAADDALYRAKRSGRNRVVVWEKN